MSKLHLLNEITTVVKMACDVVDETKLALYLDDLLSTYSVEIKDEINVTESNDNLLTMYISAIKLENYSSSTITN